LNTFEAQKKKKGGKNKRNKKKEARTSVLKLLEISFLEGGSGGEFEATRETYTLKLGGSQGGGMNENQVFGNCAGS